MTLQEWEDEKDAELDASLSALFRTVEPPSPSRGFASRAVAAARRAPLPTGRRALRRSWAATASWAALAALVATAVCVVALNQDRAAEVLVLIVGAGVRAGLMAVQLMHTSSAIVELLGVAGRAVATALSTREAAVGLTAMTAVAAGSLLMLNRLLFKDKESSSW